MNTARLVRRLDWDTDSALYELEPPAVVSGQEISHVVVSSIAPVDGHHGTLVFAATPDGQVEQWSAIARTDITEHEAALRLIGYEVAS